LSRIREIHTAGGVAETSYYGALENLFNEHGKKLRPKVMCVIQMQNQGAGMPDGGLFIQEQYRKGSDQEPLRGQIPGRGVIEVKPPTDALDEIAETKQIRDYLAKYGQVLITNLRAFELLGRGPDGKPVRLEAPYFLAQSAKALWELAAHPRRAAERHDAELGEFLARTMLHAAPLAVPQDVAWFLASYARDAKSRVERVDLPALSGIRAALEQALGMKFEGEKGEHFFRSTLVQTLFYGLFSAWVLWNKRHRAREEKFNWHEAIWHLRVPMIRSLFEQIAVPTKLEGPGLVEVMDWATAVLNRVDRDTFFQYFRLGHAVQYFYEPFLEAFDPELRKELGVWYTPTEIVQYMVARADTVLREELGLADGLADPHVYVLDPCCGTGAYLVEVVNRIHLTLDSKGLGKVMAHELKNAVQHRIFGFEILSAPFVISHLQLGLLLENLGAPLAKNERAGVYLTNSLTGWEPPKGAKRELPFAEMEEERDLSDKVKRGTEILVVLGNPPYNGFAGVSPDEEEGLVEVYKGVYWRDKVNLKTGKIVKDKTGTPVQERRYRLSDPEAIGGWGIRKFNLDDFYVRFFRLAERRIAEMTGRGVVCFISNFSYLSDPSYVIMRERFVTEFQRIWIDCMNGDSRETGKTTPEGHPDPSVFSTDANREGIRVGTAVGLMVRSGPARSTATVAYRDFWGVGKRAELLASLEAPDFSASYKPASPCRVNRFTLRPTSTGEDYSKWPRIVDLCGQPPISGLAEMRRGALLDLDRLQLESRMAAYFDSGNSWSDLLRLRHPLTKSAGRFAPENARRRILGETEYDSKEVRKYSLYPFDLRWCYYTAARPLWNEPRPALVAQAKEGNRLFITRMNAERPQEGVPVFVTEALPDYHLLRPNVVAIPFQIHPPPVPDDGHHGLLPARADAPTVEANLSAHARAWLADIDAAQEETAMANLVWMHALAITYCPAYLLTNRSEILRDWPRVPLARSKKLLEYSAAIGEVVANLLDVEHPIDRVTTGKLRIVMTTIAVPAGELKTEEHFRLTAGWGHPGKDGIVMPGKGLARLRDYTSEERTAILAEGKALGLKATQVMGLLGERTYDLALNGSAWWSNVPEKVWEYAIGGYQVIKKWLSYREFNLLGRPLKQEEVTEVMNMARRIAAILLMRPQLDANYESIKQNSHPW
jgi:hypothetical protein